MICLPQVEPLSFATLQVVIAGQWLVCMLIICTLPGSPRAATIDCCTTKAAALQELMLLDYHFTDQQANQQYHLYSVNDHPARKGNSFSG